MLLVAVVAVAVTARRFAMDAYVEKLWSRERERTCSATGRLQRKARKATGVCVCVVLLYVCIAMYRIRGM